MNTTRRTVLKGVTASGVLAGLITAGALRPTQVLAAEWNKAAFEAKDTAGALKGIGAGDAGRKQEPDAQGTRHRRKRCCRTGRRRQQYSQHQFDCDPGREEPVNRLPPSSIFPTVHLAEVSARLKMGQTSLVKAVAKADGKFYTAQKEVKVTVGGCGG